MTKSLATIPNPRALTDGLPIFFLMSTDNGLNATIEVPKGLQSDPAGQRLLHTTFAGAACERGIQRDHPGLAVRLLEEKMMFLDQLGGEKLRAEARELHCEKGHAIWRATVFRATHVEQNDWVRVAELTQTWSIVANQDSNVVVPIHDEDTTSLSDVRRAGIRGGGTEERREQILKAAYEVIASHGYANASMREIAQAAKLPIATVYLYIKSKEDLLFQISALLLGDMKDQFRKEMGRHASPTMTLTEAIRRYLNYCGKNRRFINLVYREGKSLSDENRQKILDLDRSFVRFWEEIIVSGKKAGEFDVKNPELMANYLYFLCTSWSIRHWNLKRFGEQAVCETITSFAMRALGIADPDNK
jgi:AcrR family transcriptional regulator